MIQIMLLPHPPHPDAGASHPHPQFVAAKSLMLIPPELYTSSICIMACQTFTLKMKNVAVHSRQKQLLKEKFYMDRT